MELNWKKIFPFLGLPLELRIFIYELCLFTPGGIWMDVNHRDVIPALFKRGLDPRPCDIIASVSRLPLLSPALLCVCRQIYAEARHYLYENTWNFLNWKFGPLINVPDDALACVQSIYRICGSLSTPLPAQREWPNMMDSDSRFPNLREMTFTFSDDEHGLLGSKLSAGMSPEPAAPFGLLKLPASRFLEGRLTILRLECSRTYPVKFNPFVLAWTWVATLSEMLLPPEAQQVASRLYLTVTAHLGTEDLERGVTRDYSPLLEDAGTSEDATALHAVYEEIRELWEVNRVVVTARTPNDYENGTIITFARPSAEDGTRPRCRL